MLTMRRREQAPAGALRARTRPLELTSEQAGEDLVLLRREMFESRQGRMFWQAVVHPGHPGSRDLLSDEPELSLQLRDPIGSQNARWWDSS
jgi:hypothetical protein